MQQIPDEACLFTDYKNIILFFYMNDIVIIDSSHRASDVEHLVQKLNARFQLRDFGQLSFFLGIRIIWDKDNI